MDRRLALAGVVVIAALGLPSVASASSRTVSAGLPRSVAKSFESSSGEVNQFFPSRTTIRVGDKIKFVPSAFHDITIPGKEADGPFFITGDNISGEKDAAGNPFWFNGQPKFGYNPDLLTSFWGKTVTFNGKKRLTSGLPFEDNAKPYTVRFTKAGTFRYICRGHPGMKGSIRVLSKHKKVPSASDQARAAKKQAAKDLKIVKALVASPPALPANTISDGLSAGGGVESLRFSPSSLTVPAGTVVTFKMPAGTRDIHTATTGPGDWENDPNAYLGTVANGLHPPFFTGQATYPSDLPGAPASLTTTTHGNGFWNSGVIDVFPDSPPPDSNVVKLDQAGTYTFYCLIHPVMKATIKVT